jgi:hypothetical protein
MRIVTKGQLECRVDTVMDVIREVAGQRSVPDSVKEKLRAMSYEDLGVLVMDVVKTRKIDQILE